MQALAVKIAKSLSRAQRPLVVSGTACHSLAVIEAAYNVAKALPAKDKGLVFTVPECNSLGLVLIGGRRLRQAFERIREAGHVIVLENDLYRRAPKEKVDAFLQTAQQVAVIDCLSSGTSEKAALVLPSAAFAESDGTLVNNEGRAQRYFQVYPTPEPVRSSWQWLSSGRKDLSFDTLTAACAETFPELAAMTRAAPGADFTVDGMKIPRQPHRYSGRTAMRAHIQVSEPQRPADPETPFAFSMEGAAADVPASLEPVIWAPGWNSNQAVNKFQDEIGGHLRGGDYGIRLIEAAGGGDWFREIPEPFKPESGRWRLLLLPHIFGSEELSRRSPSIAERAPDPVVLLNRTDAETLGIAPGDRIEIHGFSGESVLVLPVRIEPAFPEGCVGLTADLPETLAFRFFEKVALKKSTEETSP
jgi:NADH-quinone oxidoreductase subunit G